MENNCDSGRGVYGFGPWDEGMVGTEGTELFLQLSSWAPWADCALGLGLAVPPIVSPQ